jgi:hypothetical protein
MHKLSFICPPPPYLKIGMAQRKIDELSQTDRPSGWSGAALADVGDADNLSADKAKSVNCRSLLSFHP